MSSGGDGFLCSRDLVVVRVQSTSLVIACGTLRAGSSMLSRTTSIM
jgi:hypothetical protein